MKARLTKEQSNHLLSLGCTFPNNPAIQDHNGDFYVLIELDDLLEILPKEIEWQYGTSGLIMAFGGSDYENEIKEWFAYYDEFLETYKFHAKKTNKCLIPTRLLVL